MEPPRRAKNRRQWTREGPEPACVQTPLARRCGTRRVGRMNYYPAVVPSSRRGKNLLWVAKEWEPGCPNEVSGCHVVLGWKSSPILEVRPGNRQGWWKRSTFRWNGRQLTFDKTVGSRVWWHTQGSGGRPASDLGWGSSSKTAPGSLSTGSPAGRTPPHGDGSMYSQANVRAGKVLRPIRALPSVIVDTEKVLREADGAVGRAALPAHFGWKGDRPGVRLERQTGEPVRSPKNKSHSNLFLCLKPWRYPQQKQQWIKNGRNLKRFWRGTWRKSEVKKRWSMKQGRMVEKFILPHWWTSVIWRMPNWRQSTKNIKVELYSEASLWKMILDLLQYLQNKDHQYHKWLQQKSWISYPDCQSAQVKHRMQYLLVPR